MIGNWLNKVELSERKKITTANAKCVTEWSVLFIVFLLLFFHFLFNNLLIYQVGTFSSPLVRRLECYSHALYSFSFHPFHSSPL